MQNTVYISDVIDQPIEKVWTIMRGFNDMPSYHPGIPEARSKTDCQRIRWVACGD